MLWLRKALTPDFFRRQHGLNEAALVLFAANVEQQWTRPTVRNRVEHDRRVMAFHDACGDPLIFGVHAIAAIFGGPGHAEIARLINLALPVAQKIKLLIGGNFHEGQRQHKARVAHRVFGEPRIALLFEIR